MMYYDSRLNDIQRKGDEKLTDKEKLSEAIEDSGMTIKAIAKKLGIARGSFYKKLNNETEFKASEISVLQKILDLSNEKRDEIFFVVKVE